MFSPEANPTLGVREKDLLARFTRWGRLRHQARRRWLGVRWNTARLVLSGGKRATDVLLAASLLALAGPVWALLLWCGVGRLARRRCVGRWGEPFDAYRWASAPWALLANMPLLLNILRGDMAFIGPRLVTPAEMDLRDKLTRYRFAARPGLFSLWSLRRRTNIAYGSETETDAEYITTQSLRGDAGLALRAVPTLLYGSHATEAANFPAELDLLGLRVHNLTMQETLAQLTAWTGNREPLAIGLPRQVAFINPDCANIAHRNADYHAVLRGADLVLADGIGIKLAGKLLGTEVKQNVNGTDLFPRLCERLQDTGQGLFLLGARPGVAEDVAAWMRVNYPNISICGTQHGYFDDAETEIVKAQVRASGAAFLLVAMGAPRQEQWIAEHLPTLGVKVALGVGGLFDFYAGRIPRAPQWLREMGLEWTYRLYQEPRRMWRRYLLGNGLFLWRVWQQRRAGRHK